MNLKGLTNSKFNLLQVIVTQSTARTQEDRCLTSAMDVSRWLVPLCGGLLNCDHQKDALWDKFFTMNGV